MSQARFLLLVPLRIIQQIDVVHPLGPYLDNSWVSCSGGLNGSHWSQLQRGGKLRLPFSKSLSPHPNLGRLCGSPQSCDYFNYEAGICCSCQNDRAMGEGQELAGVGAKSVSLWKLRQTSLFLVRVRWPRSFPVLASLSRWRREGSASLGTVLLTALPASAP